MRHVEQRQVRAQRWWAIALAICAWSGASAGVALACPLCKDAIAGDPVATVLSWTTLVMIGVAFTLVASIGGWIMFAHWRAARADVADSGDPAGADAPWRQAWAERESET